MSWEKVNKSGQQRRPPGVWSCIFCNFTFSYLSSLFTTVSPPATPLDCITMLGCRFPVILTFAASLKASSILCRLWYGEEKRLAYVLWYWERDVATVRLVKRILIICCCTHIDWQAHFTKKQEISEKIISGAWRSSAQSARTPACSLHPAWLSVLLFTLISTPVKSLSVSLVWFVKKFFLSARMARNWRSRREISLIGINKQSEIL